MPFLLHVTLRHVIINMIKMEGLAPTFGPVSPTGLVHDCVVEVLVCSEIQKVYSYCEHHCTYMHASANIRTCRKER